MNGEVEMKVTIGTKVYGECGQGTVVAMSKEWCIYQEETQGTPHELAEPWGNIVVAHKGPEAVVSSIVEIDRPAANMDEL
jgi:hypothetical protein